MKREELTDQCDTIACEHDSGMWHERGVGVYCPECESKYISHSFEPEAKRREISATRALQAARLWSAGIDPNASEL